jgi:hypothetical protein
MLRGELFSDKGSGTMTSKNLALITAALIAFTEPALAQGTGGGGGTGGTGGGSSSSGATASTAVTSGTGGTVGSASSATGGTVGSASSATGGTVGSASSDTGGTVGSVSSATGGTGDAANPGVTQLLSNTARIVAEEKVAAVQGKKTVAAPPNSGAVSTPGVGVGHAANGLPIGAPGSGLGSPEQSVGPTNSVVLTNSLNRPANNRPRQLNPASPQ